MKNFLEFLIANHEIYWLVRCRGMNVYWIVGANTAPATLFINWSVALFQWTYHHNAWFVGLLKINMFVHWHTKIHILRAWTTENACAVDHGESLLVEKSPRLTISWNWSICLHCNAFYVRMLFCSIFLYIIRPVIQTLSFPAPVVFRW